jgi:hypothetical protein
MVIWCVAHQQNLVLGDVLRNDPETAKLLAEGTQAAKYIDHNQKARRDIELLVGKEIHLGKAGLTRWNSSTDLIKRLSMNGSKIKQGAALHGSKWIEKTVSKYRPNTREVVINLESLAFWDKIDSALEFLQPLSMVQDCLQADWATLDTLVFCWGWLVQYYSTLLHSAEHILRSRVVIDSIEMRWKRMEQTPYLLAFVFHP